MFGRLVAYKQQHGDCLVQQSYSDRQLASGVSNQRIVNKKGKLEAARIQRLEEIGFSWDPIGEYWEEMFSRLVAYKQEHGDCLVPITYSDKQLAIWVSVQRTVKSKGTLEPARIQRLDELGFVWKARE
jgi:hypothetical protein